MGIIIIILGGLLGGQLDKSRRLFPKNPQKTTGNDLTESLVGTSPKQPWGLQISNHSMLVQ